MTLTDYAKHKNVKKMTISRACKTGRLSACVVRDAKGRAVGISDLVLADREWARNSDYTDAPQRAPRSRTDDLLDEPLPSPSDEPEDDGTGSLAGSAARQKHWQAKLAEVKFKEAAGELCRVADAEAVRVKAYSEVKTKLLAVPSRIKQQIPSLSVQDVATVDTLIREALEVLADG